MTPACDHVVDVAHCIRESITLGDAVDALQVYTRGRARRASNGLPELRGEVNDTKKIRRQYQRRGKEES